MIDYYYDQTTTTESFNLVSSNEYNNYPDNDNRMFSSGEVAYKLNKGTIREEYPYVYFVQKLGENGDSYPKLYFESEDLENEVVYKEKYQSVIQVNEHYYIYNTSLVLL